jgi:hypothetical protein
MKPLMLRLEVHRWQSNTFKLSITQADTGQFISPSTRLKGWRPNGAVGGDEKEFLSI